MTKSNRIKSEFLKVPHGTACNRLRKEIMFALVQRLGEDICFRCGTKIESAKDFSIDHKKEWLYESTELFWDLENIAFSHLACNVGHQRKPYKKIGPPNTSWCSKCKDFLDVSSFAKQNPSALRNRPSPNGLRKNCKKCEHRMRRDQRRRAKMRNTTGA